MEWMESAGTGALASGESQLPHAAVSRAHGLRCGVTMPQILGVSGLSRDLDGQGATCLHGNAAANATRFESAW